MTAMTLPPRQIGWTDAKSATPDPRGRKGFDLGGWVSCGFCSGQGREFAQDNEGRWWARPCRSCLGVGEVPG